MEAKQNAERLHGATLVDGDEQSRPWCGIQYYHEEKATKADKTAIKCHTTTTKTS